jgi:hypothetical protein
MGREARCGGAVVDSMCRTALIVNQSNATARGVQWDSVVSLQLTFLGFDNQSFRSGALDVSCGRGGHTGSRQSKCNSGCHRAAHA